MSTLISTEAGVCYTKLAKEQQSEHWFSVVQMAGLLNITSNLFEKVCWQLAWFLNSETLEELHQENTLLHEDGAIRPWEVRKLCAGFHCIKCGNRERGICGEPNYELFGGLMGGLTSSITASTSCINGGYISCYLPSR